MEWTHEPLAFGSGVFKGSENNWSTIEQEAYAIVKATDKYRYLLDGPKPFLLFTDHKNLIYIFGGANENQQINAKLQRWSIRLSSFKFIIYHIDGEENTWADLLSRWGVTQDMASMSVRRITYYDQNLIDENFIWPRLEFIEEIQAKFKLKFQDEILFSEGEGMIGDKNNNENINKSNDNNLNNQTEKILNQNKKLFFKNKNLKRNKEGLIWIPTDATELITRLCIIAHTCSAGHRGINATKLI